MVTTILYIHDSSACWMLWKGSRLLEVFSEPIPRETSEANTDASRHDGFVSRCPWLSSRSHKVRLVIDPVIDETRSIPAFDPGTNPPGGVFEQWSASFTRIFLFLRSLTCNVWVDESTHYRRSLLTRFPKAFLLWRSSERQRLSDATNSPRPQSWQLTESGLANFVFDWLYAMDEHGMIFTDVRLVSSLFAQEDSKVPGSVITVWAEQHRCRLIRVCGGGVEKVEQATGEVEARITLDDALATKNIEGELVCLKYIGDAKKILHWQDSILGEKLLARDDLLSTCLPTTSPQFNAMPNGCRNLPMRALLSKQTSIFRRGANTEKTGLGSALQVLLSSALWRRRYRRSIIATGVVAAFSGYFVLLALMHAFEFIDLHDRAGAESELLHQQQALLRDAAAQLHDQPFQIIEAIRRLPVGDSIDASIDYGFLKDVASLLDDNPLIRINSVSWRNVPERSAGESPEAVMGSFTELMHLPASYEIGYKPGYGSSFESSDEFGAAMERLVFISGNVDFDKSQKHSSMLLMQFLDALSAFDGVIDVVPVSNILSSTPMMNFPSDVVTTAQDTGFILTIRLAV